jgi:hypothetical protein
MASDNVYGPCTADSKAEFTNWLYNYDASALDLCIVMWDFNLIRCHENRNRPGGNVNETLIFNDVISHLDLVEVPLKNRAFTWSNLQSKCHLEKLDWIFTSSIWTLTFPSTMAHAQMGTMMPKSNIFIFENFWTSLPDFLPTVKYFWDLQQGRSDSALSLSAKLKILRRGLKAWSKEMSKLNKLINNSSYVLALIDGLEEQRPVSLMEKNFREELRVHLLILMESKRVYWKQRSTIRWVKFGDENTTLFHSIATHMVRRNYITSLQAIDESLVTDHDKAAFTWTSFKERLRQSKDTTMFFELNSLIQPTDLSEVDQPFSLGEIESLINELPINKAPGPDGFNGMFIKKC